MGAAKWIGGIIGFMAGGPLGAWQVCIRFIVRHRFK